MLEPKTLKIKTIQQILLCQAKIFDSFDLWRTNHIFDTFIILTFEIRSSVVAMECETVDDQKMSSIFTHFANMSKNVWFVQNLLETIDKQHLTWSGCTTALHCSLHPPSLPSDQPSKQLSMHFGCVTLATVQHNLNDLNKLEVMRFTNEIVHVYL